ELPQHSLERPGLSLRRIVVAGVAVRLSHSDQVRCVAGEAISKVHDDAVPRVTRQGEAVQEDYRRSASVPSPVNGGFSDLGDSFDANACIAVGLVRQGSVSHAAFPGQRSRWRFKATAGDELTMSRHPPPSTLRQSIDYSSRDRAAPPSPAEAGCCDAGIR